VKEIVLDGEAMAHCKDGLPDFFSLRSEEGGAAACLFAFDLLRHNGEDLRPLPLDARRGRLRMALSGAGKALRFSEHLERRRRRHLPPRLRAWARRHRL
jgi:bifunctional non-homologous end joining protein LigD